MKLRVTLRAQDLHHTYCTYFQTNLFCCFDEVFLMALKAVFHSVKIFASADFLELNIPRGKI